MQQKHTHTFHLVQYDTQGWSLDTIPFHHNFMTCTRKRPGEYTFYHVLSSEEVGHGQVTYMCVQDIFILKSTQKFYSTLYNYLKGIGRILVE